MIFEVFSNLGDSMILYIFTFSTKPPLMSLNGINLPEKHLQTDDSQEGNDESSMWTYK